jgi:hypothetical protein
MTQPVSGSQGVDIPEDLQPQFERLGRQLRSGEQVVYISTDWYIGLIERVGVAERALRDAETRGWEQAKNVAIDMCINERLGDSGDDAFITGYNEALDDMKANLRALSRPSQGPEEGQ